MAKRKPPKRRREKSNVINLEEYRLKKINSSPLSKEFFYSSLSDTHKECRRINLKERIKWQREV